MDMLQFFHPKMDTKKTWKTKHGPILCSQQPWNLVLSFELDHFIIFGSGLDFMIGKHQLLGTIFSGHSERKHVERGGTCSMNLFWEPSLIMGSEVTTFTEHNNIF